MTDSDLANDPRPADGEPEARQDLTHPSVDALFGCTRLVPRTLLSILAAPILPMIIAVFVAPTMLSGYKAEASWLLGFYLLLRYVLRKRTTPIASRDGQAAVEPKGLTFGGKLVAAREQIRQACVVPISAQGVTLRLAMHGWRPNIDLRVKDEATARSMLTALGHDPTHAVASFRTTIRSKAKSLLVLAAALFTVMVGTAIGAHLPAGPFWWAFLLVFLASSAIGWLTRATVDVGADGVAVRSWFRKRFIPFACVSSVQRSSREVALLLHSGGRVVLGVTNEGGEQDPDLDMLGDRVTSAFQQSLAHKEREEHKALLERGSQPVHEWVQRLLSLARGAPNASPYRAPSIDPEALWRIAEDPAARPDVRLAAAVVLRNKQAPEARQRLRIATKGLASPEVRNALVRVADAATEQEYVEALECASSAGRAEVEE